jgi:DNA-binding Xre family transcriptional regulator
MENERKKTLKNPLAKIILLEVDGEKSISDLSKEINLTYKSLLSWLNKLEKLELILFDRIPLNNKIIPKINSKHKKLISTELAKFIGFNESLKNVLKNDKKKKILFKILKKMICSNLLVKKNSVINFLKLILKY